MSNFNGKCLNLTLFGESHGKYIGATLTNFPAGVLINDAKIQEFLRLRRPTTSFETSRQEQDEYEFISGVFNGYSTGAPLTVLVKNKDVSSKDYDNIKDTPRPSHADYVANLTFNGFNDYRGGGHFSGRLTTPLVIIGALLDDYLNKHYNIVIASHILKIKDVHDRLFDNYENDLKILENEDFKVLDKDAKNKMLEVINKAVIDNDSVGGVIETSILNLPVGLGSYWFNSLESRISSVMFAIPAVKSIEFGKGYEMTDYYGSKINDEFKIVDGKIITTTNNNGGINGGFTNGMPVNFKIAIKPTPSIGKLQNTINLKTNENTTLMINGRHDPCIVRRALIVINSMASLVILDELLAKGK